MQPSFCATIRTCDRSPSKNYLLDTLSNLERSGFFRSEIPVKLGIFDTGKGSEEMLNQAKLWLALHVSQTKVQTYTERSDHPLTPNQNAIRALEWAAASGCAWHLFMEDDIDVCGDFLNGLDAWLAEQSAHVCRIFPLCAAYSEKSGRRHGKTYWYARSGFYGTQAYVVSCEDAGRIAQWMKARLADHPMGQGHDLLLKEWSIATDSENAHFLCPTPDFVQHIGEESSLHPGRFHKYSMFAGHNWSYLGGQASYFTMKEHQTSKMSRRLAEALEQYLPRDQPVYDFGCGMGRYVSHLGSRGFTAVGIEGTPGIKQQAVTPSIFEHDLTKPLPMPWREWPRGSCVSIEVGEHIPKKHEAQFLENVTMLCADHLVLTWAIPGQGGIRHVNEMDGGLLVAKVEALGFNFQEAVARRFREAAGQDYGWFKKSIYVFRRK